MTATVAVKVNDLSYLDDIERETGKLEQEWRIL